MNGWDPKRGRAVAVGSEFVGTSISSGGDGADVRADTAAVLAANPHLKLFNDQRGYVRRTVTPERWQADYRVVPYVSRPGAPVSTRASFVVEAGRPGLQPSGGGRRLRACAPLGRGRGRPHRCAETGAR